MFFLGSAGSVIVLVLWVFCLFDVITSDEHACRNLPKTMWLILVILLPLVGSVVWLVAGRPVGAGRDLPYRGNTAASVAAEKFPEYDRPGRHVPVDPETDEEFRQRLRERAEEQRRAYREQQHRRRAGEEDEPTP